MTQPRHPIFFAEQKIQPSDLVRSIALLSTLLNSTSDSDTRQQHLKIFYNIETLQKTATFFQHDPAIIELFRARIDEILMEQSLGIFMPPPIFLEEIPVQAANTVKLEYPKKPTIKPPTLPQIKTIDGVEQSFDLDKCIKSLQLLQNIKLTQNKQSSILKELLEMHDIDKLLDEASLKQQNDFLNAVLKLDIEHGLYQKYIQIFANNLSVLQTCNNQFHGEIITNYLNEALQNFHENNTLQKSTKAISTKKPAALKNKDTKKKSENRGKTHKVNLNDANVDVEPLVKKQKKSNTHPKNKEHITNLKRKSGETFIFYNREPAKKVDRNDVNIAMIIEIKEKREGILIWKNGNREIVVSRAYKSQLKCNETNGRKLIKPISSTLMHLSIEELIPIAEAGKMKPKNRKNLLPASDSPGSPAPSSEQEFVPESAINDDSNASDELPILPPTLRSENSCDYSSKIKTSQSGMFAPPTRELSGSLQKRDLPNGNPLPRIRGDDFFPLPNLCPELSGHSGDFLWNRGSEYNDLEHESDKRPSKISKIS